MAAAGHRVLARLHCGMKQVYISAGGAFLGALTVFLVLPAVLALLPALILATTLVGLGFRLLRLG